jgi:peptide chain release factor 3
MAGSAGQAATATASPSDTAAESAGREATVEASRRRTFAIISHPDAGKTTLTEKFLLYAGAIQEAGAVKAQAGRRKATSDWMALEQQRGISISSTVLQFNYRDHVVNLLDTPGHRDFSEDTYRVLAAADAAVMVLDAAKGIEPQTLKLFEVCRGRNLPVITFLNKLDRPGLEPLELLDQIEKQIGLRATPVTWPVGEPGDFRGVIDRRDGSFIRFGRTARGASAATEERVDAETAARRYGPVWQRAVDECELLGEVGADVDGPSFLAGTSSPTFVGSALTNFGVRHLLDAVIDLAPSPSAQLDQEGLARPLDRPFSGFVFKMQANMNPAHRDHVAFVRVCSGQFVRGSTVIHGPSGRPFATKYAASVFGADRITVDQAWPGDVVGLVNASGLRIGDTLYVDEPVTYPRIPAFPPELLASARPKDISRDKQFRRGVEQLEQEGVVQVLARRDGEKNPVLAAVGQMQFDVFAYRMQNEFGADVELSAPMTKSVRITDEATAQELKSYRGAQVLLRRDGALLAFFDSPYLLDRLESDHPAWVLRHIVTT